MMNDYVFLEDVSRRVGEWGMDISRGGFSIRGSERGRGRGRGRGRRGDLSGGTNPRTKQDKLQQQLELRDIEMELLPLGMEKKKLNRSIWDFKKKTALLTIEFIFHAPPNPSAPSTQPREPPYTLITHKNRLEMPLITLLQSKVNGFQTNSAIPSWITSLVHPDPDDPDAFILPQCLMAAQMGYRLGVGSHPTFHRFDPDQKLSVLLRDKPFVEFPTIEVWEEGDVAFVGTIVNAQGSVTMYTDERRMMKRRKLDVKAGKKVIHGLLGDYESEDDEVGYKERKGGVISVLDEYVESDDNDEGEAEVEDLEEDKEAAVNLDPTALLELVQQAQALDAQASDEDLVDWGDSDEGESV